MTKATIPPRHVPREVQIQVSGTGYFLVVVINQRGDPILSDDGTPYFGKARSKAFDLGDILNVPAFFNEKHGSLFVLGERGGVVPYYTRQAVKRELEKRRVR